MEISRNTGYRPLSIRNPKPVFLVERYARTDRRVESRLREIAILIEKALAARLKFYKMITLNKPKGLIGVL